MPENITVRPGQTWEDCDSRFVGRTLRVDAIEDGKAVCTVLTNSTWAQQEIDEGKTAWVTDRRGKTTRIRLDRLRPTSAGYRLVQEAPTPTTEEN